MVPQGYQPLDEVDDFFQNCGSLFSRWDGGTSSSGSPAPRRKGFAGISMKEHADLEACVATNMSARGARAPIPCSTALSKVRGVPGMPVEKGTMPVKVEKMLPFLNRYPDTAMVELLEAGFREGFCIPSEVREIPPVSGNLHSTLLHQEVVSAEVFKEVALGCIAGPFPVSPLGGLVVSPLGVVPKKELRQFGMIHHLSYPKGGSVNDGINPQVCEVTYTSFDAAIAWVWKYGQGSPMAKSDFESAFWLLPVHPQSFHLLRCCWQGSYFVDHCLLMGCSVSCALFEIFNSFLEWAVREVVGVNPVHRAARIPLLRDIVRDATTPV